MLGSRDPWDHRGDMPESVLHQPILGWYSQWHRDLPWRRPGVSPWEILVSEVMLQQTPVSRVLPVYDAWLARWPTPAALAAAPPGDAVRLWGRLGYPRRALRLHQAATALTEIFSGAVPRDAASLRSLPGIGEYTAAAIRSFAFRERVAVLDTNVRRVLGRLTVAAARPPATITRRERETASGLLPDDGETAASWNVATMELGALVCTARGPACDHCPVSDRCAWRTAGYPESSDLKGRSQSYVGTDRQCRGRILQTLREADSAVPASAVETLWDEAVQRERALASLVADGLVVRVGVGSLSLP
jgi:A/G-specific adenine glycosylase